MTVVLCSLSRILNHRISVSFSSERVTNVVYQTLFRLTGERQEVMLIHDPTAESRCKLLSVFSLSADPLFKVAQNSFQLCCYCVKKMMTTCSPMIGQFFDTMIVASNDKQWL